MARPTTKATLTAASENGLRLLLEDVDALPERVRESEFPFESGDRCVRDVFCHLHEWHRLMLGWYDVGMSGRTPVMPAAGYTWKTTPALNAMLRARHRRTSLAASRAKLLESHRAVQALINAHSDAELFTRQRYSWTGSTSLGAYFVSSTSSHYDWARKKIRRLSRTLRSVSP